MGRIRRKAVLGGLVGASLLLPLLVARADAADCGLPPALETLDQAEAGALIGLQKALQAAAVDAEPQCLARIRGALRSVRRAGDRIPALASEDRKTIADALHERDAGFEFRPGDVLLLRSPQMVSAAVSQIGTEPTEFSHAAIVGYDPAWRTLDVVEALAGDGVRIVPLEDWLDKPFVRFAVFRYHDAKKAERAAVSAYRDAEERQADDLWYDFKLLLHDHTRLYCTEVVSRAFEQADPAAAPLPAHLSDVGTLVETFPMKELGAPGSQVFLADDLELDARFEPMLELRVPEAVVQTEIIDARFREIFARLRGPEREQMLAEIDAAVPPGPLAIAYAFGGGYFEYQRLPKASRARIAGIATLVEKSLKAQQTDTAAP